MIDNSDILNETGVVKQDVGSRNRKNGVWKTGNVNQTVIIMETSI